MSNIFLHLILYLTLTFSFCEVIIKQKCFTSLSDGTNCNHLPDEIKDFTYPLPDSYFGTVCCYEEGLECFSNRQGTPFECFPGLPDCMYKIRPDFFLYTPENSTDVQTFDFFNLNSKAPKLEINSSKSLFLIIHGFGDEWPKPWITDLKDALISLDNNVLVLRWTKGSQNFSSLFNYFKAAANSRSTGAAVAKVIRTMIRYKKVDLSRMTIIGYSLGAHVAGHVGRKLDGLRRIIALDPAGPLFACQNPLVRLDPTDADYVEVIHTNGDDFFYRGIGTLQPMGHSDFYANSGRLQPGCKRGRYHSLQDLFFMDDNDSSNDDFWCSHSRAPVILTDSIRNAQTPLSSCNYTSFPCSSDREWSAGHCFTCPSNGCPIAGYSSDDTNFSKGKYFFNTLKENVTSGEFCGSQVLLSLTSDIDVEGKMGVQFQFSKNHKSALFQFQSSNETLFGHKSKSVIFTLNWEISRNIVGIVMTHFPNSTVLRYKSDWNIIRLEFNQINISEAMSFHGTTNILIKPFVATPILLF